MEEWRKRHPRLSAIGSVIAVIATALATFQGIWNLVSDEPLLPYIAARFPQWAQIILPFIFGAICIFFIVLLVRIFRQTKNLPKTEKANLTDILTAMHRRLVELQKEKASHTKISFRQYEEVMPSLANRMGTVKLKDWYEFKRNLESRFRRAIPRRNFRRLSNPKRWFREFVKWKEQVHLTALSIALELKNELFQSKEWTFEDGTKAAKWLDGYDWGVQKLRDNDPQWKGLYESIGSYLKDDVLPNLITRHIGLSYIYNNICLIIHYSSKFKDDVFSLMLHETLVGSPISPVEIDSALSEILRDIDKRMTDTKKKRE